MVERQEVSSQTVEKVGRVYDWLDQQIRDQADAAGACDACGECCDFEAFDHRLFLTPPELMHLAAKLAGQKVRRMPAGRCPYNIAGKCTIYDYRFAGCRIFCCKGDAGFQSRLSETALEKFKSICTEFGIPYLYSHLADALNSFAES